MTRLLSLTLIHPFEEKLFDFHCPASSMPWYGTIVFQYDEGARLLVIISLFLQGLSEDVPTNRSK
jgi:NADPH-dependent 7-cyano-7-deazaguanine reductase QueF